MGENIARTMAVRLLNSPGIAGQSAALNQPSLRDKKISPHILRRTCAMQTLQATKDIRKVALWLGHASTQTTEAYLRMDPSEKLDMMDTMIPPAFPRENSVLLTRFSR